MDNTDSTCSENFRQLHVQVPSIRFCFMWRWVRGRWFETVSSETLMLQKKNLFNINRIWVALARFKCSHKQSKWLGMLTQYEVTLLALRALKVTVTHVSRSFSHFSSHLTFKTSRWVPGTRRKHQTVVYSALHQTSVISFYSTVCARERDPRVIKGGGILE